MVEQDTGDQDLESPAKKRKENLHTVYSAGRSELLGMDPRSVRADWKNKQQPGFYLSETGRKGTLILHRLGACFAIPGLDYLKFQYVGPAVPARSQYHQVCKLCARGSTLDGLVRTVAWWLGNC